MLFSTISSIFDSVSYLNSIVPLLVTGKVEYGEGSICKGLLKWVCRCMKDLGI